MKHNQIECNKKQTLQFAFLQEKINLKNNKIVKLKKKYLKKRQQLAIENEQLRNEIDDLKQKCSSVSKKLSELSSRDENANSSNLENRNKSVSYRIRAVIDEIEKKMIDSSPPSVSNSNYSHDSVCRWTNVIWTLCHFNSSFFSLLQDAEIKASVLDILRSTNLENTTMRNLISMVGDKYSQFDLSNKREFIKSVTKAAVSTAHFHHFAFNIVYLFYLFGLCSSPKIDNSAILMSVVIVAVVVVE